MIGSVLLVEDEAPLRASMAIALRRGGHEVTEAGSVTEARAKLEADVFDLVLTDLRLPDGDGLGLLRVVREIAKDTQVVVVTAYGTVETAVEAMQLGAQDFIQKPFATERLIHTVRRSIEHGRLLAEVRRLHQGRDPLSEIVGESLGMREVRQRIAQAAGSRSVLIMGETGTGKELVAKAVHAAGVPDAPFVVVNCAGLSETLLESELFGHTRGAFTGAIGARKGLLAEADGGTLFLDEVGEIPLRVQAKLLRFLQFGEVRPVGGNQTLQIKARVAAATNRDLTEEVKEQRFRGDLFYRLDVFRIALPPLRERKEDLPDLCGHLLRRLSSDLHRQVPRLGPESLAHLARYAWPGNVRELENALERAMLVAPGPELLPEHFPLALGGGGGAGSGAARGSGEAEPVALAEVERRHILRILAEHAGDRRKAVQILGISRSTLRRKLIEYGAWTAHEDGDEDDDR